LADFQVTVKLKAVKADIAGLRSDVRAAFASPIPVKFSISGAQLKQLSKAVSVATSGFAGGANGTKSTALMTQYGKAIDLSAKKSRAETAAIATQTAAIRLQNAQRLQGQRLVTDGVAARTKAYNVERQFMRTQNQLGNWYAKNRGNIDATGNGKADVNGLIAKLGDPKQFTDGIAQANLEVAKLQQTYRDLGVESKSAAQKTKEEFNLSTDFNKLGSQARNYYAEHSRGIEKNTELSTRWAEMQKKLNDPATLKSGNINETRAQYAQLISDTERAGASVQTLGQRLGTLFGAHLNTAVVMFAINALRQTLVQAYQNVVQLDKAVVDLQIATGGSRSDMQALLSDYSKLGQEIGATTLEVAQSSDTFLRQGKTLAETEVLIRNSMMLSKLGQISADESASALTSAMKGYKVSVEDSLGIVDKLTAVDLNAATSSGELAVAMQQTAVGASIAGLSMDKLIGQLAVVMEVSQQGAEQIGNFEKTMLSRIGNLKEGRLVDPETEESLSSVDSVLTGYGIKLRESNSEFRNFGDVLDEVAGRWDSFGSVAQRAIAVAFAG
jgi:TP901 family phage tail tape measure protein